MKVIKRYILIEAGQREVNETIELTQTLGEITGPYYSRERPEYLYDTEEEAIEAAYKRSKYWDYMIVPYISFDISE